MVTLSLLLKGTEEDRLRWAFMLYDTNGDGYISREEMEDITHSVKKCVIFKSLSWSIFPGV